jgi:hypothetical protein
MLENKTKIEEPTLLIVERVNHNEHVEIIAKTENENVAVLNFEIEGTSPFVIAYGFVVRSFKSSSVGKSNKQISENLSVRLEY